MDAITMQTDKERAALEIIGTASITELRTILNYLSGSIAVRFDAADANLSYMPIPELGTPLHFLRTAVESFPDRTQRQIEELGK